MSIKKGTAGAAPNIKHQPNNNMKHMVESILKDSADASKGVLEMNKKQWVMEIEHLLKKDEKNNLKGIEYIAETSGEEYALIKFDGACGESAIKKCITANSKAATLIAITEAVYY